MNKPIDITGVVLTTARLTLRPWRESDLPDFYEYASVDGVGQMAGWNPHRNAEESRMILSHFIEGKHVFALEYKGKVIGSLTTMFAICFIANDSKSGNGMPKATIGLTLSYSF